MKDKKLKNFSNIYGIKTKSKSFCWKIGLFYTHHKGNFWSYSWNNSNGHVTKKLGRK